MILKALGLRLLNLSRSCSLILFAEGTTKTLFKGSLTFYTIGNCHRSRVDNTHGSVENKASKSNTHEYKICKRKGEILTNSRKGYKTVDGNLDS